MLIHKGTQRLNTDRLLLRRFESTDADDMFRNWANDSEVTKFLTWKPHDNVEVTREIIEQWVSSYEDVNFYNWAIELKGKFVL